MIQENEGIAINMVQVVLFLLVLNIDYAPCIHVYVLQVILHEDVYVHVQVHAYFLPKHVPFECPVISLPVIRF